MIREENILKGIHAELRVMEFVIVFKNDRGWKLRWNENIVEREIQQRKKVCGSYIIQIMHIREVVSKICSPRGNFIKVWNRVCFWFL